jgi:hypothetical protein
MKCSCCGKDKWTLQQHHKFPQTLVNKKLYGDLIHHNKNIQLACDDCHVGHRSTKLIIWSEAEFCAALRIKPRSKTAMFKATLQNVRGL